MRILGIVALGAALAGVSQTTRRSSFERLIHSNKR
jgi:hypothetical protein